MRIRSIEINSFRGIPNQLKLEFPIKNSKPVSLIIIGDNGSGKSSIIDAFEFCLQGHISQSEFFSAERVPSIVSFSNNKMPSVSITFENGEKINREIIKDEQGLLFNNKAPAKLFSISPFILRRHDILRFLDSADSQKTLVFRNYLRNVDEKHWIEHPEDELIRLQDERLKAKNSRDSLINKLAAELKVSSDEIPMNREEYSEFINLKLYGGFNKSQIQKKGYKINIKSELEELADNVIKAIELHRKLKEQISKYNITPESNAFPRHLIPQMRDFLNKVAEKLTTSFLEISPLYYVESIKIKYDPNSVLAVVIEFYLKNGKVCLPKQILSEANLDLLALLFYIAIIQESADRGQAKFLILDDVLQSVDATIRVSFLSYLLKNLSDWQLIITAHDRLWQRQVRELMNKSNYQFSEVVITKWSFETGPTLNQSIKSQEEEYSNTLESGDLVKICSGAGLLLEQICDILSINLFTSVQRKQDDRYTLSDLWSGVAKILRKTQLNEIVESIDSQIYLRNLLGAHYNEWALSLSLSEAKSFGESVLLLYYSVKCEKCSGWILSNFNQSFYSCKCGDLIIQKK